MVLELDLNRAGLEVTARVVKADGSPLSWWMDVVAPVNMLGAVMWQQLEVILNGQPFSGASSVNVGYKALVETLLSADADARDSHLNTVFFHVDSPRQFGNMAPPWKVMALNLLEAVRRGEEEMPEVAAEFRPVAGEAPVQVTDLNFLVLDGGMTREEETPQEVPGDPFPEAEKALRRRNVYRAWFTTIMNNMTALLQAGGAGDDVGSNIGFTNRYKVVTGSTPFDMYSPLTHDFFRMDNMLGPGNRVEIRLTQYPHKWLLNSYVGEEGYKLELLDLKLHLHAIERKERIPPPILEKYLFTETQMHRRVLARETSTVNFRIHNGGPMPKTILVAMVSAQAADGMYAFNPLNLHHFYAKDIHLLINGEREPANGLKMDFTKENPHIAHVFNHLFENTGARDGERGNLVTWSSFQGGSFIVPFDLTPDKCNGLHFHDSTYGFIDLVIEFSRPLPEPVYVLYELVFNKRLVNNKATGDVHVLDIESGR